MVIWLIGLSGAGKTSVGRCLYEMLKAEAPNTVFVDGDDIRALFHHDQGEEAFTLEGRRQNAQRITDLCAWLDRQGINVVCCILSVFPELRRENRNQFSNYFEAYLKVPMAELKRRDAKGIYAAADKGVMKNVVGIDIPFPEPEDADIIIPNEDETRDFGAIATKILVAAKEQL